MPETSETDSPSLYMRLGEVAHLLAVSVADVRNKCEDGELLAINVATRGKKAQYRVSRESFEEYRARREAEAVQRFGGSAA